MSAPTLPSTTSTLPPLALESMSGPPPGNSMLPPPAPELFMEEELDIVKNWTNVFKAAGQQERYQMLKTKILSQMLPLNRHLTDHAWKVRKLVSTTVKMLLLFII